LHYADISGTTAVTGIVPGPDLTADGYSEITLCKFLSPSTSGLDQSMAKTLAIATYNSSLGKDKGGKLTLYAITKDNLPDLEVAMYPRQESIDDDPGAYGTDTPHAMSWTGLGRVVALDYKK
jgi:hypothetical protein